MNALTTNPRSGHLRLMSVLLVVMLAGAIGDRAASAQGFQLRLEHGHPWRPPFGLERVGTPFTAVIQASDRPAGARYVLTVRSQGKEVGRHDVRFSGDPPYSARVPIEIDADEVVLSVASQTGAKPVEVLRQAVEIPELEAEAVARPDSIVNPVDLGTILVPRDSLLLGPGQSAVVEVAAISRRQDMPQGLLKVWLDSDPQNVTRTSMPLRRGVRVRQEIKLPKTPASLDRDALSIAVEDGNGRMLWRKSIPVMLVREPPRQSRFGATYERLRYDAPISVRDPRTGKFSDMPYEGAWAPDLRDVVVRLPNGARFVFWRGSSYIPFWAGRHNTGLCYEWAEIISQPSGAVDCVEPLMDKELRYSRVEIVESTAARVHVRWSYQSTDFEYKVWGDAAVEDYYLLPGRVRHPGREPQGRSREQLRAE